MGRLRYTNATDYIAFIGDHWYEDRPKALGIIEDFMDDQLIDAEDKIRMAEEALVAIGISETDVRDRGKALDDQVTSYEAQVDYYTNYIKGRDDWEFVGIPF